MHPSLSSGYLAPYFTEEDTDYLLEQINSMTPLNWEEEQLLVWEHMGSMVAIGAALFMKEFIHLTLKKTVHSVTKTHASGTKHEFADFMSLVFCKLQNTCKNVTNKQ